MSKITLVTISGSGADVGLYKDGHIIITADPDFGESTSAVLEAGERLASIEGTTLDEIFFSPKFVEWSWDDVTIDLLGQGKLAYIDMSYFSLWQTLRSEENNLEMYSAWLVKHKKNELIKNEEAEIDEKLRKVFGDEAIDRINKGEDSDAYNVTVCLSAHQRLTYFAEVTVPSSATLDQSEEFSEILSIDAENYEIDPDYWEDLSPTIDPEHW